MIVSVTSLFEISIKLKIGKLVLDKPLDEIYQAIHSSEVEVIPITTSHLLAYQNVPFYANHRDPFDRLILATGVVEEADVIGIDPKFQQYSDLVTVVW